MESVEKVKQCNFPYVQNLKVYKRVIWADCFILSLSQPPFVDRINKQTHVKRGTSRRRNVACIFRKQWYYIVFHHTKKKYSKHTTRKSASKKMQSAEGSTKELLFWEKGRKRKGGEKAFLHLHCTTGGLHAVFTRRLCEFEITWVTESLFHPLFFVVLELC